MVSAKSSLVETEAEIEGSKYSELQKHEFYHLS